MGSFCIVLSMLVFPIFLHISGLSKGCVTADDSLWIFPMTSLAHTFFTPIGVSIPWLPSSFAA